MSMASNIAEGSPAGSIIAWALPRRLHVVQEPRRPQSCQAELPAERRQDLAVIGVVDYPAFEQLLPYEARRPIRLLCPFDRPAVILALRLRRGQPTAFKPVDVRSPVPGRGLDQRPVSHSMEIGPVGRDLAWATATLLGACKPDLECDVVPASAYAHSVHRLVYVDEVDGVAQRVALSIVGRRTSQLDLKSLQLGDDTIALC